MKASIIQQILPGGSVKQDKRLIIPENNNLIILSYRDNIIAYHKPNFERFYKVVSSVEVPDELIEKALAFVNAKDELNKHLETVKKLLQ